MSLKLPVRPLVWGGAAYAAANYGPQLTDLLNDSLKSLLSPSQVDKLVHFLKPALFYVSALSAVSYVNGILNSLAHNNFRLADPSAWNWPQEIAVVTGGCSGLGKGISEELAKKGVRVIALDISNPPKDLESNPKITFMKCDVTNSDQVAAVAQQIKTSIGHPSILINNAGIGLAHSIIDTSAADLQKIVGVNLMSHYYTVREFVPHMIEEKKGHIVTMASVASFVAAPGMVDYGVTKAGLTAFHDGLQSELRAIHQAPEIHTTIVHPLWIATPLVQPHMDRLKAAGQPVMEPHIVINAVVDQILSGSGGQLVLGKTTAIIRRLRFYPRWLYALMMGATERAIASTNPPAGQVK